MISQVWKVDLVFDKPKGYGYVRLRKVWKDQIQLAEGLKISDLHVESNRRNHIDYTLERDRISFNSVTLEDAVEAQDAFVALMKNRGYKRVKN